MIKKSPAVRIHKCTECGLIIERDHNAAINILNRAVGTRVLNLWDYWARVQSMKQKANQFNGG